MIHFSYYVSELPFILITSIAVYLSFDYWRFPDLTIEGSITAGMVSTYLAFTYQVSPVITLLALLVIFPLLYACATWFLALAKLPPLFAGLLVVLVSYTLNFLANGSEISQTGFIHNYEPRLPSVLQPSSFNVVEKFLVVYFVLTVLIIILLISLSRTKLWIRLYLSRRTLDPLAPVAIGINRFASLFLCMWLYNSVAFLGGVGFALSNDTSAVTFLGAITPGLACTFIVRAVRGYVSAPSKTASSAGRLRLSAFVLRMSDSLTFTLFILVVLSVLITAARFVVRDLAKNQTGLLNAYTAFLTLVVWFAISGFAKLMGKQAYELKIND